MSILQIYDKTMIYLSSEVGNRLMSNNWYEILLQVS